MLLVHLSVVLWNLLASWGDVMDGRESLFSFLRGTWLGRCRWCSGWTSDGWCEKKGCPGAWN